MNQSLEVGYFVEYFFLDLRPPHNGDDNEVSTLVEPPRLYTDHTMASPPPTSDIDTLPPQDKWGPVPEGVPEHGVGDLDRDLGNGPSHNNGDMLGPIPDHGDEYHRRDSSPVDKSNPIYREKQIKVPMARSITSPRIGGA